jgi:S-adenosylmethionine:tRNA ribosyltransferase-isomerase
MTDNFAEPMPKPDYLRTADYQYDLPNDRIALYPVEPRDASKLLVYADGKISDSEFGMLQEYLTSGSLLVANDTAVVNARLIFHTAENQRVEIFLLEPVNATWENALVERRKVVMNCLIGNRRKWKKNEKLKTKNEKLELNALVEDESQPFHVTLSWNNDSKTFADVLNEIGHVPLPPYIKRADEIADKNSYQTVYAEHFGSVAAPTAGLHITPHVISKLSAKNCSFARLTLHVGAGTFKPVDVENALEHEMHPEAVSISLDTLQLLIRQLQNNKPIAAVGTTATRTLESLHAMGVQLLKGIDVKDGFDLSQFEAYEPSTISTLDALNALVEHANRQPDKKIHGKTSLMIVPGFQFRLVNYLITNFHQPGSTLLMLVSAFVGDDWKKIYEHALRNDYRFLSYGDSSLLKRKT